VIVQDVFSVTVFAHTLPYMGKFPSLHFTCKRKFKNGRIKSSVSSNSSKVFNKYSLTLLSHDLERRQLILILARRFLTMRYNTLKLIEDSNCASLRLLAVDHIRRQCYGSLSRTNGIDSMVSRATVNGVITSSFLCTYTQEISEFPK